MTLMETPSLTQHLVTLVDYIITDMRQGIQMYRSTTDKLTGQCHSTLLMVNHVTFQ